MPIQAQSADGKIHEFPDGTDPAVVDRVMKDYAQSQPAVQQQAPVPQGPPPWQAGTERTPFTAPNVTGNRTLDVALEPVTGYMGRTNKAYDAGKEMASFAINHDLANGDPSGLVGLPIGAMGMVGAPVSAALEPVGRVLNEFVAPALEKTIGMKPEVSVPVMTSLIPGLGITKAPGMGAAAPARVMPSVKPTVKLSEAPTNQELRSQAGRSFKAAENAGVMFKAEGVERLRQSVLAELEDAGFDVDLHPRIAAVVKRLDMAAEGNLTLKGGEIIRRVAQNAARSLDKDERRIGWRVIDQISEFLSGDNPGDVLMGDAKAGGQALANAREIWARMSKSEAIDLAIENAERRASKTGSGANIDNVIRQNVDKILGKDGKPRGFTTEEVAVMKKIVNGTTVRNALRGLGKMSPTGVVSGGFGLAATATIPLGWMLPITGFLAKLGADSLTKGAAKDLSAAIRSGDRSGGARVRPALAKPRQPPTALSALYDQSQNQGQ